MYSYVKNKQRELFGKEKISSGTVASIDSLSIVYKFFSITGVNRIHGKENKYSFLLRAVLMYGIVNLYLPMAFAISYVKADDWDSSTLFTSLQVFINCIANTLKVTSLILMTPKLFLRVEKVLVKLDARCVSEEEVQLLYKLKNLGQKATIVYTFIYFGYSTCTCIAAVISGHPPYNFYLPSINWQNSTKQFLLASFLEWFIISGACFQNIADDAYAVLFVFIIRTHLNALRMRMKRLGRDDKKTLDENEEELKMCIKDHKNIIEVCEIIAPVISVTIFIQFTVTAVVLSLALINILIFGTTFASKLASFSFVLAICVEVSPLCYCCNCLLLDVEKLSHDIFYSPWVSQSPSYRKMLRFFLQRTQKPMNFTAGKIYPINLASFISIAKFAFSLYTFIKQLDIKQKLGVH